MSEKFRWLLLGVCGVALLGCSDTLTSLITTGPTPIRDLDVVVPLYHSPRSGASTLTTMHGGLARSRPRMDDIPPEYYSLAQIKADEIETNLGPSSAVTTANADYFGTHWSQTSVINLRFGSTQVATSTNPQTHEELVPTWGHLFTAAQVGINKQCGFSADGHADYKAEIKWKGEAGPYGLGITLSSLSRGKDKPASQGPCVDNPPPSSGGGDSDGGTIGGDDGGGGPTCYFYYEYYKDTGEIIYTELLGCW